jgi:hypothetical protein
MNKFTEQEIETAISKAPIVVQEALVTDPFLDFGMNLQSKYQLHVDIAGSVGNLMSELLQFLGIPVATAQQLTKDLNEKVFTPLQAKMLNGGAKDPSEPSQLIPDYHAPSTVRAPLTGALPPATQNISLPPKIVPVVAPIPQPAPVSTPSFVPPVPTAPAPIQAGGHQMPGDVRTMASDMVAVQSGGLSPGSVNQPIPVVTPPVAAAIPIYVPPAPPVMPYTPPTPTPVTPPAYVPPAPAPAPVVPPAPRPTIAPQIQQVPAQVAPPAPVQPRPAQAAATANENREALHQVLKEYGVDPYREPAE